VELSPEMRRAQLGSSQTGPVPAGIRAMAPLNSGRFAAYTLASTTNERR
jgi:hypothetical protein